VASRTHPATVVVHGPLTAEVDVDLAPLVLEVWRAGIATIHSCQDVGENVAGLAVRLPHLDEVVRRESGRASVGFAGPDAMTAFLGAVANAGPRDGLYERMVHWASPGAWQLLVTVSDRGLEEGEDLAPDGTPWSLLTPASFTVRFPRTDVQEMTERMRRHNAGDVVSLGRPTWAAITVDEDEDDA
jgi:hypothetical protein